MHGMALFRDNFKKLIKENFVFFDTVRRHKDKTLCFWATPYFPNVKEGSVDCGKFVDWCDKLCPAFTVTP